VVVTAALGVDEKIVPSPVKVTLVTEPPLLLPKHVAVQNAQVPTFPVPSVEYISPTFRGTSVGLAAPPDPVIGLKVPTWPVPSEE
jgi:hypothetical protein